MTIVKAVKKITKRQKRNGYYEASEILTSQEKQSLVVFSLSILVPLFITSMLLLIN